MPRITISPKQRIQPPTKSSTSPQNASKADIKARYFELVRIHHPDSPLVRTNRIPEEIAQARFQAITAAYDKLRGKKPMTSVDDEGSPEPVVRSTVPGRGRHRPDLQPSGDDRWKDRLILAGVVLAFGGFFLQNSFTRRKAIEDAAARARQSKMASRNSGQDENLKLSAVTSKHPPDEQSLGKP